MRAPVFWPGRVAFDLGAPHPRNNHDTQQESTTCRPPILSAMRTSLAAMTKFPRYYPTLGKVPPSQANGVMGLCRNNPEVCVPEHALLARVRVSTPLVMPRSLDHTVVPDPRTLCRDVT